MIINKNIFYTCRDLSTIVVTSIASVYGILVGSLSLSVTTTVLGDQQHTVKKQQQKYDSTKSILLSHP